MPKASAPEFHHPQKSGFNRRPTSATRFHVGGVVSLSGGPAPTACGANSLASALGASPGATPDKLCEHNTGFFTEPSK
jgi:hypothetical protein